MWHAWHSSSLIVKLVNLVIRSWRPIFLILNSTLDYIRFNPWSMQTNYFVNLRTHPEHMSSPPVFSGVRVARTLVLCVCFVDCCLSLCTFYLDNCLVLSLFDLRILITSFVSSSSSFFFLVKPTTKMSNLICPTCGSFLLLSYLNYNVISGAIVNVLSCNPLFMV